MMILLLMAVLSLQLLLLDAGHDGEEISLNTDWDTPLMLACRNGCVAVAKILIERFPRCIPWMNKRGLDAVSISQPPSEYLQRC